MKILIRNAIKCNSCGDEIESTHRHDFKWCSCKSCAVDGGLAYQKRCAKSEDSYTDISEYREATREEKENFIKENIDDYFLCLQDIDIDLIVEKLEEM